MNPYKHMSVVCMQIVQDIVIMIYKHPMVSSL